MPTIYWIQQKVKSSEEKPKLSDDKEDLPDTQETHKTQKHEEKVTCVYKCTLTLFMISVFFSDFQENNIFS